jgi:hypothetical protein
MKPDSIGTSVFAALSALFVATQVQAAQLSYTTPSASANNNFTILDPNGGLIGGSADVVMTWDGTIFDAASDYTGPGSVSNMTLSSATPLFGSLWTAHDIQVFGPGSYAFDVTAGGGVPETGTLLLNVGPNQLGAHMLIDWNINSNIDVAIVWDRDTPFPGDQTFSGPGNWDLASVDGNGDGVAGIPMASGGPFAGVNANFNLNGANTPPTAGSFGVSAIQNTSLVIDLAANASDPDGGIVPASALIVPGSGPAHGAVVNNGDGTVTYTPDAGFLSPPNDSFQYTIQDTEGATSNVATVTISVTAALNTPPVASDTAFTTDEDVALQIAASSVASDADGDPLSFQSFDAVSTAGGTLTVDGSGSVLTYTPPADFNGVDSFAFTVTDGMDTSNVATATVTVNPANDALVCADVNVGTGVNTSLAINVPDELLSTCTDPDGDTITLGSVTQPTQPGSTLSFDGANTLTYTPPANFAGMDSFTYTATDGTATDTRTVIVRVGEVFGNFTMLDPDGVTFGGTNDIVFSWDGTCYSSVAEADAGPSNMSMASASNWPFFGFPWAAHDIKVFCPGGPYTFDTCNAGVQAPNCGPLTMTVPPGHVGGHILLDWNVTTDIDVAVVWNNSTGGTWQNVIPSGEIYQGPAGPTPAPDEFYDWISVDADGDGIPGIPMVDSPFLGFRANFSFKTRPSAPQEIPVAIDIKPHTATNVINLKSHGPVAVAVLSDADFDARQVVPESTRFGPGGAAPTGFRFRDVDKDGDLDLLLHFRIPQIGLTCADVEATLTGETLDGTPITGTDSVVIKHCSRRW